MILPDSTDRAAAPRRLEMLIKDVLTACPEAAVLVAKIIDCTMSEEKQSSINDFNSAIPDLVAKYSGLGYKIRVVDQTNVGGQYLSDRIHPTDAGYNLMAENWSRALEALPDSWIEQGSRLGRGFSSTSNCSQRSWSLLGAREVGHGAAEDCTSESYRDRLVRLIRSCLVITA
jgi:hypothetical protein